MRNKPLMAYRSNRRRQNPTLSVAFEPEEAIGSRRANSPLWSLPEDGRSSKRPNIREQSYLQVKDGMFANEEESIYAGRLERSDGTESDLIKCGVYMVDLDDWRLENPPAKFRGHYCSELYSGSTVQSGTMNTAFSVGKKSRNSISRIQSKKVIRLVKTGYVRSALETCPDISIGQVHRVILPSPV